MSVGVHRRGRWLAVLLAAALVVAACSGGGDDDDDGGQGGNGDNQGDVEATADPNGVLKHAYDLETNLTDLDPGKSGNTCDGNVWTFIYDTLIHNDGNGNLSPGLAEEWQNDGNSVTVTLREGLTFHDGTPLDAEAVKKGIDHNNENGNLTDLDAITSIDVVNPRTVKINLEDNSGTQIMYDLSGQEGMIVAPSALANASERPVGAGPFEFDSYSPGSRLKLTRFEDSWEADEWKLGGIEFIQVGIGPPTVTAIRSGSVDLARFQPESFEAMESAPDIEVGTTQSGQYAQLELRVGRREGSEVVPTEHFGNVKVRQAINHAINREELNEAVEVGKGEVAWSHFPKDSPFHVDELDERYPYDPDRAKELLAEAGFPDGFEFEMAIPGGNIANMESQAVIIQRQLKAVGVTANIVRILPQDIANEYYLAKKADAFSAEELAVTFPPNMLQGQWGQFQFVAIHDGAEREDISNLMKQAFEATEQDEIIRLVQEGEKIAVEQALDVPIAFVPQFVAWNSERVGGTPVAPPNSCIPSNLRGVFIKQG